MAVMITSWEVCVGVRMHVMVVALNVIPCDPVPSCMHHHCVQRSVFLMGMLRLVAGADDGIIYGRVVHVTAGQVVCM